MPTRFDQGFKKCLSTKPKLPTGSWLDDDVTGSEVPISCHPRPRVLGTETGLAGGEGQLLVDGRSAKTPQKKSVLRWEILNFDWRAGMVDCCPSFHRLAKAGIAEKICCWWGPSPHPTHYCGNTWDPLSDLFLWPPSFFFHFKSLSAFPNFPCSLATSSEDELVCYGGWCWDKEMVRWWDGGMLGRGDG